MMLRVFGLTVVGLFGLSFHAMAQGYDIGLAASAKNISGCAAGDSQWAKKYKVDIAGDVATVSAGTAAQLKKVANGTYESVLTLGNSGTFTVTLDPTSRSLKVVSKSYGCIWEGKA
jgi:hypothetical protein